MTHEKMNPEEREAAFLESLEASPLPSEKLLGMLKEAQQSGAGAQAASLAELLAEAAREQEDAETALQALEIQWTGSESLPRPLEMEKQISRLFGNTPEIRSAAKNAGFRDKLNVSECFRRLNLLRNLREGVLCFDKTWGFGVVREVHHFYEQVDIDFDRKKDHHMAFGYAAETLMLLDPDHLLARRHDDPESLRAMASDKPGELVRLALSSFGPMTVVQLQECLTEHVLGSGGWKKFWEEARKELKRDPLVDLPAKRSEVIQLRHKEKSFGDDWFEDLRRETRMEPILDMIDEMAEEREDPLSGEERDAIGERLHFVIQGAGRRTPALRARALIRAVHHEVSSEIVDRHKETAFFVSADVLLATLPALSAREVRELVDLLLAHRADEVEPVFVGILPDLDLSLAGYIIEQLEVSGRAHSVRGYLKDAINRREITADLLLWLWKNIDQLDAWAGVPPGELMDVTLYVLERPREGASMKAHKWLKDRFKQPRWLKQALDRLEDRDRRRMMQQIRDSSAWPEMDRRSVMGQIIKLRPELEKMTAGDARAEAVARQAGPVTSHRSYLEKQEQLRKITQEEIPQNSKEIAVARSYGDLRENFEYKAAKDHQSLLMNRQAELQKMLNEVTPTTFDDVPAETAGQATRVELEYPDGRTERYVILGVWDQNDELGIISSNTRLAQAVMGKSPGDTVSIPRPDAGEDSCTLKRVDPLPEAVRDWIRSEPPTGKPERIEEDASTG